MTRLAKKFIFGILSIMLLALLFTVFINTKIVQRFYLYQQRGAIEKIGRYLEAQLLLDKDLQTVMKEIEKNEKVIIVYSDITSDSEVLSNDLRERFREKGLGFQNFWLWDQDYHSILESGKKRKIYQQDKLNYGILVEYISFENKIFAIAAIVPNTRDVVAIINSFLVLLQIFSLLTILLLIFVLVRHITNPLKKFEAFSEKIGRQEYEPLCLKTGDELEAVADSMNRMGESILEYQRKLMEKNMQMEQLLDNVAHDLKTPISLIKMYTTGIKEGMDDGTFLDVVIKQNTRMEQLTEQLLNLSRIGQKEQTVETVRLDLLLFKQIEEMKIMAEERNLTICVSIVPNAFIAGNIQSINSLFSNLLSNSIKYADGNRVNVTLKKREDAYIFSVANKVKDSCLDLNRIWEPFYVGEESRNKALSGTGLGLAIVKKISEQSGYYVSCKMEHGWILFQLIFKRCIG